MKTGKQIDMSIEKILVKDLKPQYFPFGNKGNVWKNDSHIYKSGKGNLCGTPALSTNWAMYEEVTHVGCKKCIEEYNKEEK